MICWEESSRHGLCRIICVQTYCFSFPSNHNGAHLSFAWVLEVNISDHLMGTGRLCSVSALHALPTLSQNHGDPWPASGECDDSQGTVVTVSQAAHHNHSGVVSHNLLRNDYFNYLISADTSGKVFI